MTSTSVFSRFTTFLALPMKVFNTRMRLSFGLAVSVFSLVLMAQAVGVIADPNQSKLEARKLQTEALAMAGSTVAESPYGFREFAKTMENGVKRTEDLISAGLRKSNGRLSIEVGTHAEHWKKPESGRSNDQFMFVPIYRAGKPIGELELCFQPLNNNVLSVESSALRLGVFLFIFSFGVFNILLHRTLNQLDPRGAVPQRVREAFDTMAEGLLILDRTGRIMLANGKFGSLVGKQAGRLTGTQVSNFAWQNGGRELPWIRAIAEQQPVTEASLQIVGVNNVTRTFNVSAAPVMGQQGSSRGVMVTFDDITALEEHKRELIKARNEADAANESKSNFLSRMSHEIRTPMNAIIGYTDILQQEAVSKSDQVRYLTTIQSSGEHLLTLINDILDLSKVEAGQMTIERRPIALIPLLTQVIDTLIVKASEKNLLLALEIDGKVPHQIETDETRLRQILINMIGNAVKFTADGSVRLIVRAQMGSDRPTLHFDVVDTGIGMSASAMENIFDPFTQADSSVTRRFGGTGLGLAICKQLSESLGGQISVQSKEGEGTVFSFSIDPGEIMSDVRWVTQDTLSSELSSVDVQKKVRMQISGGHVLIVDDGTANRDLAALMLKRLGLTFEMATNGKEALEKVSDTHFDVVLMDMNMPVMDGLTATRHIRQSGLDTPVVALTALAAEEERMKCIAAGCSSFLAKPIRQQALLDVLGEYLEVVEIFEETPTRVRPQNYSESSSGDEVQIPSDIETSLAATLASLGFNDDAADSEDTPLAVGSEHELKLPDVVKSSLPLDLEYQAIVAEFVERLPAKLVEFDQALEERAAESLRSLGHWLAGGAGTVGLDDFVDPAREIEYSKDSDWDRISQLIDHIGELSNRIVVDPIPD